MCGSSSSAAVQWNAHLHSGALWYTLIRSMLQLAGACMCVCMYVEEAALI